MVRSLGFLVQQYHLKKQTHFTFVTALQYWLGIASIGSNALHK